MMTELQRKSLVRVITIFVVLLVIANVCYGAIAFAVMRSDLEVSWLRVGLLLGGLPLVLLAFRRHHDAATVRRLLSP